MVIALKSVGDQRRHYRTVGLSSAFMAIFIALQMVMRRKVLDVHYLLQLLAAFVFGYLCDACIWLLKDVEITAHRRKRRLLTPSTMA